MIQSVKMKIAIEGWIESLDGLYSVVIDATSKGKVIEHFDSGFIFESEDDAIESLDRTMNNMVGHYKDTGANVLH